MECILYAKPMCHAAVTKRRVYWKVDKETKKICTSDAFRSCSRYQAYKEIKVGTQKK